MGIINNKFRVMLTWDGRMGITFEEAYTGLQ